MNRTIWRLLIILLLCQTSIPAQEEENRAIRWEEFSPEAFQRAEIEGKLVFLSLMAPWGHWDRLMQETTFQDPDVISLLNDKYVPVRVDPLERPDISVRYSLGGWPTSTFLLPDGQPFFFPGPQGKIIRAGGKFYAAAPMAELLRRHAVYFSENREATEKLAADFAMGALSRQEVGDKPVDIGLVEVCISRIIREYSAWVPDPRVKKTLYSDSDSIDLGVFYSLENRDTSVRDLSMRLLTDIARGGIRDHLGGGFHRYATDAGWRVPVFEKTLDVNAVLLETFGTVYKLTGNQRYHSIADELAKYVTTTLRDPAGWFYAYQSADSPAGGDGDYYTWTLDEAKSVLTEEELKIMLPAFDIGEWGEMVDSAPRRNVIFLFDGPYLLSQRFGIDFGQAQSMFDDGRRKMLESRNNRTPPPVGHVLTTDANATMASSLILVGSIWNRPDLVDAGIAAVDFLWSNVLNNKSGLMDHLWKPDSGQVGRDDLFTDQVRMTQALVTAYEGTGKVEYLVKARGLARRTALVFADSLNGGYMDRVYSSDLPGLLAWPNRSIQENARFAEVLVRLDALGTPTGLPVDDDVFDFVREAREALESWADDFQEHGTAASRYGLAVMRLMTPPMEVVVAGDPSNAGFSELRRNALTAYHPWRVVRYLSHDDAAGVLQAGGIAEASSDNAVYLCRATRCTGPFDSKANMDLTVKELIDGTESETSGQ